MGFLLFFIQFFDQFQLFNLGEFQLEKYLFLHDEFLEFCLQFSHKCDFLCYDCEFLCGLSVSGEFWSPRDLISMLVNKCVNMLVDKFQGITIRKWNKQ